ncbi:hypothetical protein AVEN_233565-1, partial [Araneus ventricosus]
MFSVAEWRFIFCFISHSSAFRMGATGGESYHCGRSRRWTGHSHGSAGHHSCGGGGQETDI